MYEHDIVPCKRRQRVLGLAAVVRLDVAGRAGHRHPLQPEQHADAVDQVDRRDHRPGSRKAGHLEPFTRVTLQMAQGRDLWIITQAETVESYPNIRENLVRTAYASYVMELAERFTYEEGASLPLYQLIHETLKGRFRGRCQSCCPLLRDPPARPGGVSPPVDPLR